MDSKRAALLVVGLGAVVLGGSFALDAATPDRTITYGVDEIAPGDREDAKHLAERTTTAYFWPTNVEYRGPDVGMIYSDDERAQAAIRDARDGTLTVDADDADRSPLSRYDYAMVELETEVGMGVGFEWYRVSTSEREEVIRLSAERLSVESFLSAIARPLDDAEPRVRTLVSEGTLATHEPIYRPLYAGEDRFYEPNVEDNSEYTSPLVTVHDAGYPVGAGLALIGILWWLYQRGSETVTHSWERS